MEKDVSSIDFCEFVFIVVQGNTAVCQERIVELGWVPITSVRGITQCRNCLEAVSFFIYYKAILFLVSDLSLNI